MRGVSESLAGRAAVLSLLPLSLSEVFNGSEAATTAQTVFDDRLDNQKELPLTPPLEEIILRGSYPEVVANPNVDRQLWCGSYLTTYLERDVRNLEKVGDLGDFERFLRLCAVRTGQILNLSELARDVGVSVTTAKRWLSVLEASYQIFLLHPYYRNLGKRLIKSPKIYFGDTGLASYLMGLNQKETLTQHPGFAQLFETLVVTDFLKRFLNAGQTPPLYYLRTQDDLEVDLVIEQEKKIYLYEVKSSATIYPKHTQRLRRAGGYFKEQTIKLGLVSNTAENFGLPHGVTNYSWRSLLKN